LSSPPCSSALPPFPTRRSSDLACRPYNTGTVKQPVRYAPRFLVPAALAAVLLTGCGSGESIEAKQLTIITSEAVLDQATSMAIAHYVQVQGTEVESHQRSDYDDVMDELAHQTPADHAHSGVGTTKQTNSSS